MPFDVKRLALEGNSSIGIFAFATDTYAIFPISTKKMAIELCKETLQVTPITISLVHSKLLGLFATGNENGIIVPDVITFDELETLKKQLSDINVEVIHSKITAFGNTVTVGEKVALVHPEIERSAQSQIENALDVEVIPRKVMNNPLVGSIIYQNKNGFLAHPLVQDEEIRELEKLLNKQGDITTVNRGTPYPRPGIVGNNKGVLVGSDSTGPEMMRIFNVLSN